MLMKQIYLYLFIVAPFLLLGCSMLPTVSDDSPRSYDGVQQVVAFSPWLFSGSKPSGDIGFTSLQTMQVQTIICVDGIPPELDAPEALGMKTYHIPIKYGQPTKKQILDLAAAVEIGRRRGNSYIHCHHGKHRSAAAAAVALIGLGISTREEMEQRMSVSETSSQYEGLWIAVAQAEVLDEDDFLRHEKTLQSKVLPEGMTEQMIAIDDAFENLSRIEQSNWNPPIDHPDIVAVAEAGAIAESFRCINKSEIARRYSVDFETQLSIALSAAIDLERALSNNNSTDQELSDSMRALSNTCTTCHRAFRK